MKYKIRFKRLFFGMLGAALLLSGCGAADGGDSADTSGIVANTTAATTEKAPVMKEYRLKEHLDAVKVIGRSAVVDAGITCDWTASGLSLAVTCEGEVSIKVLSDQVAYFTVIVDGVRQPERVEVKAGTATVTLARGLEKGTHEISFLKQTENTNAMCILHSVSFAGSFAPRPADRKRYIEFYGDSITSGYGNLAEQGSVQNPGSARWQDGTQTYAFLAADLLGADWSMISVSGIPFSKGYTSYTMGSIMEKINWRRFDTAYDFARKPDLVVINLGTNDAQCGAVLEDVKSRATEMIRTLKGHYGEDQKILFVTCMMNTNCRPQLLEVIQACGGEEAGLYEMQSIESNRFGGNGHPDMTAHVDVSEELVSFILSNIF